MLGILCRISQEKEDGKDRSIKEQKKLGKQLAKELGLHFEYYIEEGISGTLAIDKRPALDKLLSDIEDGKITSMFIWMQDRLERNPQTRFIVKQTLIDNNCKLFTEDGEVDFENDALDMHGDMMSIFNAYFVRTTKKRVKAVLKRNAEEGKAHGISAFGYTKDENGAIIIDEDEVEIVRRIYKMSLSGIGTNKIAEIFNQEGIQTRYNKIGKGTIATKNKYTGKITTTNKKAIKWSGNTVRSIIKNTLYKGERNFGGKVYEVPAIFNPTEWQRVNDNLTNNRNNSGKSVSHKYLLKGLIRCGVCGRNYYGKSRVSLKDNFYMCSSKRYKHENCGNRSINITVLEGFIWKRFFEDNALFKVVKNYLKKGEDSEVLDKIKQEILNIEKSIKDLEKERKRAISLTIKGVLDESDVESEIKRISREKRELEIKKDNLNDQLKSYNKEELEEKLTDLEKIKENTSFNDKKEIIKKFINEIVVAYKDGYYTVAIWFNLPTYYREYYVIDRGYNFAASRQIDLIVPLNEKFKEKLKMDKDGFLVDKIDDLFIKLVPIKFSRPPIEYYWKIEQED
ncbi:recombinase family protein [Eudoraea adriatica]|uniref:recombinase family protein n=1 Tax=Eudoraea adriatica TaxID=446681 RepID=UPI000369F2CF|nr:recombinase family protein [Eudoraea adriatica]